MTGKVVRPFPFEGKQEWMADANCQGMNLALFFPERGELTSNAKAVCKTCAVLADCRDYALTNRIMHGIWGGLSERERRRMRRGSAAS